MSIFNEQDSAAQAMLDGLQEVVDKLNGKKQLKSETYFLPPQNSKAIREGLGLSQAEFSERFCIPRSTIQNWEQERRVPDQATNAYLFVIKSRPDVVAKCITKMHEEAAMLLEEEAASD